MTSISPLAQLAALMHDLDDLTPWRKHPAMPSRVALHRSEYLERGAVVAILVDCTVLDYTDRPAPTPTVFIHPLDAALLVGELAVRFGCAPRLRPQMPDAELAAMLWWYAHHVKKVA
jgi:hypothetical protein